MSDALVYGGIDLINGEYGIGIDSDFGSPQAVTSAVRSLFLDGSVVTGRFSDNRTLTLTVEIRGTSRADLSAKADALAFQVDQPTNTLSYTPSGGLMTVWDTFRGQMTAVWDYVGEYNFFRRYQIVMPALPFGRTPSTSTLSASTTTAVTIDDLETAATWSVNGSAPSVATSSSSPAPFHGTNDNLVYNGVGVAGANYVTGSRTIASVNITGRTIVGIQQYNGNGGYNPNWTKATLTLSSSGGSSTWVVTTVGQTLNAWSATYWDLTQTPSSTTGSGYSASAVTGWTVRLDGTGQAATISANFDYLAAYPPGYGMASSADAGSYTMAPVAGSARCPLDLRVDRGGTNTLADLLVYQAPVEQPTSYQPLLVGTSPYSTPAGAAYAPGTYTVIVSIPAASQGTARSVALSIQQTQNGTNVGTAWASGTIASGATDAYIVMGEVTLPLVGTAAANSGVGYTVTATTGAAYVLDVFLLDTRGALVFIGPTPLATAAKYLFVSAPSAATGVGGVYSGSTSTLSDATWALSKGIMSGGQMAFSPGSNTLVVCSTQAASDLVVTATYSPRWLTERTS